MHSVGTQLLHNLCSFLVCPFREVYFCTNDRCIYILIQSQEFLCPGQLEMLASELFTANNEKKDKQCLLDTPRTVMVNKENYYQEIQNG